MRWRRSGRAARRASADAGLIDRVVDAELAVAAALQGEVRPETAERLAVLVLLANAHRRRARGWCSSAELRRQRLRAFHELQAIAARRPVRVASQGVVS